MDKKEAFKEFLKNNKDLIKLVRDNKITYQKLFETYDIYGEDALVWNEIRNIKKNSVKDILGNLKNIDLDKLEDNVGSLEKALDFLEEIITSRNDKKEERKSKPKKEEIERFFDD